MERPPFPQGKMSKTSCIDDAHPALAVPCSQLHSARYAGPRLLKLMTVNTKGKTKGKGAPFSKGKMSKTSCVYYVHPLDNKAGKSPAFKAILCRPNMQEGSKDQTPFSISIDDMSHDVLGAFVRFFYTATIDSEIMEKHSKSLYCAAEKYGVKLLKTLCEEWITKNVSHRNAISNLELAKAYNSEVVKDAVLHAASLNMDKIPSFAEYQAYAEKNPGLLVELYEGIVKMMSRKRSREGKKRDGDLHFLVIRCVHCESPFDQQIGTDKQIQLENIKL